MRPCLTFTDALGKKKFELNFRLLGTSSTLRLALHLILNSINILTLVKNMEREDRILVSGYEKMN